MLPVMFVAATNNALFSQYHRSVFDNFELNPNSIESLKRNCIHSISQSCPYTQYDNAWYKWLLQYSIYCWMSFHSVSNRIENDISQSNPKLNEPFYFIKWITALGWQWWSINWSQIDDAKLKHTRSTFHSRFPDLLIYSASTAAAVAGYRMPK